jgi:hypothetical protein
MLGPMSSPSFDSFSRDGEDVVLWRALHMVGHGRYVDVGAGHPRAGSTSMAFYAAGWSGITVEPDPAFVAMQRDERPLDRQVHAAAASKDEDAAVPSRCLDTILDEAGWRDLDIHFVSIDAASVGRGALEGLDLRVFRPWVLVVQPASPSREAREQVEQSVLHAGYQACLFNGLSCFYVSEEHAEGLAHLLGYPACSLDGFTRPEQRELVERARTVPSLVEEVSIWRAEAISRWSTAIAASTELDRTRLELEREKLERLLNEQHYHRELEDLHESTSWRVTQPLRWLSAMARRLAHP